MYKDRERQKEANRRAKRRQREKQGMTSNSVIGVIPYRMTVMERCFYLSADILQRDYPEKPFNFVSKPGCACYSSKNTGE